MILLDSVSKSYTSEVSIGPVDLEIPNNAITALIGPNGAGTVSYTHLTLPTKA